MLMERERIIVINEVKLMHFDDIKKTILFLMA